MRHTAEYCFARAADCEQHAKQSTDKETRTFILQMRDSWIAVANRVGMFADGAEPPLLADLPRILAAPRRQSSKKGRSGQPPSRE
jgi:hypothetical protein